MFQTDIKLDVFKKLWAIRCNNHNFNANGLHIHNAITSIHIFSVLEYARVLLKCFWFISINHEYNRVIIQNANKILFVNSLFQSIKSTITFILNIIYNASGKSIDDINADTGVEALPWASGNQLFIGNNHTFVQNHITESINASLVSISFTFSKFILVISRLVSQAIINIIIQNNHTVSHTEHKIIYFQAASQDVFVQ